MDVLLLEITKSLGVFGLTWFSFWAAIPTGIALGLHPLSIVLITTLSYASGVLLFVVPARFIRKNILKRFGKYLDKSTRGDNLIVYLWNRYGVIGFGLLAPIITGAQLGALIGIALDIPRRRLAIWMIVGVFAWSAVFTLFGCAGANFITG